MKMSNKQAMKEAIRRYFKFQLPNNKDLTTAWIGLGTEAEYRKQINDGLMKFFRGEAPPKRCLGWLTLTSKGCIEFLKTLQEEYQIHQK